MPVSNRPHLTCCGFSQALTFLGLLVLRQYATMQVAETNTAAGMYSRAGFHIVQRTRDDWTSPIMRVILRSFLGYGTWHRMVQGTASSSSTANQHYSYGH